MYDKSGQNSYYNVFVSKHKLCWILPGARNIVSEAQYQQALPLSSHAFTLLCVQNATFYFTARDM